MNKVVIGIVGEKGSGKGTFPKLLQEMLPDKKIVRTTFSDVMTETLNIWGLNKSRENYIKLVVAMRDSFGPKVLADAVKKRIGGLNGEIIVVDGMRWLADLEMIKSIDGKIVYITADPKIRFERTKLRGEKDGEIETTFEQFMEEEKAPTEVDIPEIAKNSDFTINNNGSFEEFKNQVNDFIQKLLNS
ncbi:AAA family ATPase [Candidatus Daviesbacteria bacterium]|nr:AAA family ATPase [Candidatus Daviesbacteria bacterium]